MDASFISEKGLRPSMEDAHYLDLGFGGKESIYGGIYDGHNGYYAANYTAKNLHKHFLDNLLAGLTPGQAFSHSYETVSQELKDQESGTTSVDFFIHNKKIYTANVGDCRAIVVNQNSVSQLTVDHRLDNLDELKRILKMKASINYPYVIRGNMGLMPTRSIGDHYFKAAGVISSPSLGEYFINPDDLILISACDGLWDFMNNEEVAALSRRFIEPKSFLNALKQEVIVNRVGSDNLTVIAVFFS
jgi:serine/threonine protein phosphatase PrpC